MFARVSQIAERVATSCSRRGFLARLGQQALALAGVLGGLSALPADAQAADLRCCVCCYYDRRIGYYCSYTCTQGACPKCGPQYKHSWYKVSSCAYCGGYY